MQESLQFEVVITENWFVGIGETSLIEDCDTAVAFELIRKIKDSAKRPLVHERVNAEFELLDGRHSLKAENDLPEDMRSFLQTLCQ